MLDTCDKFHFMSVIFLYFIGFICWLIYRCKNMLGLSNIHRRIISRYIYIYISTSESVLINIKNLNLY